LGLVEDETRRYKPTKNYLEQLGQPLYHSFEVRFFRYVFSFFYYKYEILDRHYED